MDIDGLYRNNIYHLHLLVRRELDVVALLEFIDFLQKGFHPIHDEQHSKCTSPVLNGQQESFPGNALQFGGPSYTHHSGTCVFPPHSLVDNGTLLRS